MLGPSQEPHITNMAGVSKPARLKLLIYGAPGVGKTWLAGDAPKPLLFDFDGGAASLAGRNVDVVERPTTDEFQGHVHWLLQEGGAGYETIIVDTLTAAQKQTTVEVMGQASRMSQQLWGDTLTIWRKLLIALEGLPCNLLIICHEKEENLGDEDHAVKRYTYALQGSISSDLHAMFDSIGRMTKRNVRTRKGADGKPEQIEPVEVRRIRFFAPAEDFVCKDRLNLFGREPLKADVELLTRLAHEKSGQPEAPAEDEQPKPAAAPPTPPPAEPKTATPPAPAPASAAPGQPKPAAPVAPPRRRKKAEPKQPTQPTLPEPESAPDPDDADAPPPDKDDTTQPPEGDDFPWEQATSGGGKTP